VQRAFVVAGYPQAWDVPLSLLRAGRSGEQERWRELDYDQTAAVQRGAPIDASGAQVLILDPTAPLARRALAALPTSLPLEVDTPRLRIATVRDTAR
jgi:hypothetical protein